MRYLAVLQVRPTADQRDYDCPQREEDGWLTVGNWEISAEMDASRPACIEVRHQDGSAVLAADRPEARLGSKRYRSGKGQSIVAETVGKKTIVERSRDELPEAAR